MARIEGEVQRYQFGPGGDEWVRAKDYADLNEHSALVEMNLQAQIDLNEAYEARLLAEVERLRAATIRAHNVIRRCVTDGVLRSELNQFLTDEVEHRMYPVGTSPSPEAVK